MNEGLARACRRMALTCAKRRDLSGAARYAREALVLDECDERSARLLALCLWEMGEPGGAAYSAEAASALAEQEAALERVRDLWSRGKWRRAVKTVKGIVQPSVRALNVLGCLYAAKGRYRRASAVFSKALERDEGNALARTCLLETARGKAWR